MSPKGLVNVALAGVMTRAWAVFLVLWDMAEKGRPATKKIEPTAVAAKQAGRTISISVIINIPWSSVAKLEVVVAKIRASRQVISFSLVFILNKRFRIYAGLSNKIWSIWGVGPSNRCEAGAWLIDCGIGCCVFGEAGVRTIAREGGSC